MSMTAFELMAKLSLDKKEYDSGLNNAENEGRNAGSKIGNALGNAAKVGMGLITAATGVAATGLGILGKQAVSSYAQYEQLIGGVEKLYGEASDKLVAYAHEGYMTAGMSANQYMEIATSFSSALINSLGGDVDKAADMTDLAMQSISDNVNIFGSSMESVQMAFQGFAKQNFVMLDNLKLGYGGTKTEMERLIADASKMTDEQKELNVTVREGSLEFDNIVSAIAVVQKHMNIAGTTTKEAMRTIEGSARATKAAWQNVITAIAGGGDLEKAFNQLTTSVFGDGSEGTGLLANIIPRLQKVMEGIGQFVSKASPYITKYIPQLFEAVLPPLLDAAVELAVSLAKALPDIIKVIIDTIPKLMKTIANALKKEFPTISLVFEGLSKVVEKLFKFIGDNGKTIVKILEKVLVAFLAFKTLSFIKEGITTLIPLITKFATGLTSIISTARNTSDAIQLVIGSGGSLKDVLGVLKGATTSAAEGMSAANTTATALKGGLASVESGAAATGTAVSGLSASSMALAGVIGAVIAALGFVVYKLIEAQASIKSVEEAQKELNEATRAYEDAARSQFEAMDRLEESHKRLAEAEQIAGQSGNELYDAWERGEIVYENMTEAQKNLIKAYAEDMDAQTQVQETLEQTKEKKQEMAAASYETELALVRESGMWGEYRDSIVNAFQSGEISAQEAKDLIGNALDSMDADTKQVFLTSLPEQLQFSAGELWNYQNVWSALLGALKGTWNMITGTSATSMETLNKGLSDGVSRSQIIWQEGLDAQLSEITGHNIQFQTAANGNVQMYVDGVASGKPRSQQEMASLVTATINEISKQKTGAKTAGEDLIHGVNNGIGNQSIQNSAFRAIKNFGQSLLNSLRRSLEERSPSKATREMGEYLLKGLSLGIDDEKRNVLSKVSDLGQSIIDSFNTEMSQFEDVNFAAKVNVMAEPNVENVSGLLMQNNDKKIGNTYNFYQTNNSPKALSTIDIYRQTRNQFSQLRGATI